MFNRLSNKQVSPKGYKEGGRVKKTKGAVSKKSMTDQFFDAINRKRAKKIFDVRKRIDERFEKQRLEGLRETGKKMLPKMGSKGAEKKFGRVRVVTPGDIERVEQRRKQDKAFEKAGFVNTINLKKGGMAKLNPGLRKFMMNKMKKKKGKM